MKKTILIVLGLVIIGGGGFYGGIKYDQNKTVTNRQNRFVANAGGNFAGRAGGIARSGGAVSGEVLAKDEKSITVKIRDGGSKIVFFSSKTNVSKSVDGSADDVKIGGEVSVFGSAGQDGSIVADSIQIRPMVPVPVINK